MFRAIISIRGLESSNCSERVETHLKLLPFVDKASFDHVKKEGSVDFLKNTVEYGIKANEEKIIKLISVLGHQAEVIRLERLNSPDGQDNDDHAELTPSLTTSVPKQPLKNSSFSLMSFFGHKTNKSTQQILPRKEKDEKNEFIRIILKIDVEDFGEYTDTIERAFHKIEEIIKVETNIDQNEVSIDYHENPGRLKSVQDDAISALALRGFHRVKLKAMERVSKTSSVSTSILKSFRFLSSRKNSSDSLASMDSHRDSSSEGISGSSLRSVFTSSRRSMPDFPVSCKQSGSLMSEDAMQVQRYRSESNIFSTSWTAVYSSDNVLIPNSPSNSSVMDIDYKEKMDQLDESQLSRHDFLYGDLLGVGSFAKVMHAEMKPVVQGHTTPRYQYAIKIVDNCEEKLSAIALETKLAKKLDHKFVTHGHYCFKDDFNTYMCFELVHGGTLKDLIFSKIPSTQEQHVKTVFDEQAVLFYLTEIVDGLQYIHSQNIVHRDLKCDNIFITASGHVKIGDFGSACELTLTNVPSLSELSPSSNYNDEDAETSSIDNTGVGTFVGTAEYLAPEFLGLDVCNSIACFSQYLGSRRHDDDKQNELTISPTPEGVMSSNTWRDYTKENSSYSDDKTDDGQEEDVNRMTRANQVHCKFAQDFWALGCIGFKLLFGITPFSSSYSESTECCSVYQENKIYEQIESYARGIEPLKYPVAVSSNMQEVISLLLNPDPIKRLHIVSTENICESASSIETKELENACKQDLITSCTLRSSFSNNSCHISHQRVSDTSDDLSPNNSLNKSQESVDRDIDKMDKMPLSSMLLFPLKGFTKLKSSPFFSPINWDDLTVLVPPFRPDPHMFPKSANLINELPDDE